MGSKSFVKLIWMQKKIGAKEDFFSKMLAAQHDFCSNILMQSKTFVKTFSDAKEDFCLNILGVVMQTFV